MYCQKIIMRTILIVFAMLVAWKVVRTDWIVTCPWESYENSPGSHSGVYEASFRPPVSPAWSHPRPIEGHHEFQSWEDAFSAWYGSGSSFPRGTAALRPDWALIALKIGFPLMLISLVHILRLLNKKRGIVMDCARGSHSAE